MAILSATTMVAVATAIGAVATADSERTKLKIKILDALANPDLDPEARKLMVDEMAMNTADRKFMSDMGKPFRTLMDNIQK